MVEGTEHVGGGGLLDVFAAEPHPVAVACVRDCSASGSVTQTPLGESPVAVTGAAIR